MDETCWNDFCQEFELIGDDLSERDRTLAFVCSRMRVVDEQSDGGRIRLTYLSFQDFLEALCRCSVCKAWPTRAEIEAAETFNAGAHLLNMRGEDPPGYEKLQRERAAPWGVPPLQPVAVCVAMLCELLIVKCKCRRGASVLISSLSLTEKEVASFLKLKASD